MTVTLLGLLRDELIRVLETDQAPNPPLFEGKYIYTNWIPASNHHYPVIFLATLPSEQPKQYLTEPSNDITSLVGISVVTTMADAEAETSRIQGLVKTVLDGLTDTELQGQLINSIRRTVAPLFEPIETSDANDIVYYQNGAVFEVWHYDFGEVIP